MIATGIRHPTLVNNFPRYKRDSIDSSFTFFKKKNKKQNKKPIKMPSLLKVGSAQARTLDTLEETLRDLEKITKEAASKKVDVLLFPEGYLGGYPHGCNFGAVLGSRTDEGRSQFLEYFRAAIDLGDTPAGAGDDWVEKKLPKPKTGGLRGDGTREELERISKETGIFLVVGLIERSGGTLYCGAVYVDPARGCLGKRRKVMPVSSSEISVDH